MTNPHYTLHFAQQNTKDLIFLRKIYNERRGK